MQSPNQSRSRSRWVIGFLAVVVVVTLTACRLDGDVDINVDRDGSGSVTVRVTADAEAAAQIGDPTKNLRIADLSQAGWKVDSPRVDPKSGALVLKASRPFRSSAELAQILSDVGRGPASRGESSVPFIDGATLGIEDAFARTDYNFSARLHMAGGLAQLSDPTLTEVLGGLPVGRTPEELTAAGVDEKGIGTLRIRVRLPGGTTEHNGTELGDAVEWTVPIGADNEIDKDLRAGSRSVQRKIQTLVLAGVVTIVVAAALGVVGFTRRRS